MFCLFVLVDELLPFILLADVALSVWALSVAVVAVMSAVLAETVVVVFSLL